MSLIICLRIFCLAVIIRRIIFGLFGTVFITCVIIRLRQFIFGLFIGIVIRTFVTGLVIVRIIGDIIGIELDLFEQVACKVYLFDLGEKDEHKQHHAKVMMSESI